MHTIAQRRRFPGIYAVTLGALRIAKVRTIARPSFGVLEALNPISKPQYQTIKCMIADDVGGLVLEALSHPLSRQGDSAEGLLSTKKSIKFWYAGSLFPYITYEVICG